MEEAKKTKAKLFHAARIQQNGGGLCYLLLRKKDPHTYSWYRDNENGSEVEEPVSAPTVEEAIRLAHRFWKNENFRTLGCGFRYTLPERDEHGINALFHQMAASYNSPNGVYFDDDLGNNCFINFASQEARNLLQRLKQQDKL
jgi:hypothetical protein